MVETLRTKARHLPIRLIAGEGAQLPFSTGQFDVVAIARLLYLTADWRRILRQAHRVLAGGGRLLHEWGNGQADEEWVQIREKARAIFEEGLTRKWSRRAGCPCPSCRRGARLICDVRRLIQTFLRKEIVGTSVHEAPFIAVGGHISTTILTRFV